MSKLFGFSESLGKRVGKKWSQICRFLLIKGVKLPWKKSFLRIFLNLFVQFKHLFAPTFRSPMSKLFWIFGILGEKCWKEVVSDLKIFAHKGCKIAVAKKVFYRFFNICSFCLNIFLPPLPEVQCPNFLDFRNLWGKVLEKSGLRFENFC